jgi:hypothetical protein
MHGRNLYDSKKTNEPYHEEQVNVTYALPDKAMALHYDPKKEKNSGHLITLNPVFVSHRIFVLVEK